VTLSFKDVTEILKLIDASSCHEVIIEVEGLKLTIRKGDAQGPLRDRDRKDALPMSAFRDRAPQNSDLSQSSDPVSDPPRTSTVQGIEVRAAMVGTFYRRPSPEEEPFVTMGGPVKKGDPLGLIEVMKLHTSIPSPSDGLVASIDVEDGKPVEFNQLLFVISAG
jgi:acetyl-CoA carboxylase biotin carboxyl carrier protein